MRVRPERVANAMRREISSIIHDDLKDTRIGFTTVTKVEVTSDLRNVKVYYSVLGDKKQKKATEIALNNAKGYIKRLIGDRIKLRFMPDIIFRIDKSLEHRDNMERLFDKIKKDKGEEWQ